MILGLGTDIIDIRRIERTLARHGDRFLTRVFTDEERRYADARPGTYAATLAKRFAAKEACAKALGTGIAGGVYWRDIGVVRQQGGPPSIKLTGGALERLESLIPVGTKAILHLTLTDDLPQAQAIVIVEALPL